MFAQIRVFACRRLDHRRAAAQGRPLLPPGTPAPQSAGCLAHATCMATFLILFFIFNLTHHYFNPLSRPSPALRARVWMTAPHPTRQSRELQRSGPATQPPASRPMDQQAAIRNPAAGAVRSSSRAPAARAFRVATGYFQYNVRWTSIAGTRRQGCWSAGDRAGTDADDERRLHEAAVGEPEGRELRCGVRPRTKRKSCSRAGFSEKTWSSWRSKGTASRSG